MEYCVVRSSDLEYLERKVNQLIREGWGPQGGINGFYTAAGYHYQQAMVNKPATP